MKESADIPVSINSTDRFIREKDLSRMIGLGLSAIRKAEREGVIRAYRPLGTRAKVYYWPEVRDTVLSARIERPAAGARYTIPTIGREVHPKKRSKEWFS